MFNLSDPNGIFRFSNALPFGANLSLAPYKNNDPLNGVSTFDLVLINKHILGQQLLSTPYQIIAADVNGSGSVSTYDIVELRKLILGLYTEFPANTSWRFVDAAYLFPNPFNPFQEPFPETRQVMGMSTNMEQENFIAVKVGDVNGNAITNSFQHSDDRSSGNLFFDVLYPSDVLLETGEQFTITLSAAEAVLGCQFTLRFPDLEILRVDPGENMDGSNFAVFRDENALSMSWDGLGKPVFALTFRARKSGRINEMLQVSSLVTKAEAYLPAEAFLELNYSNSGIELRDIALRFSGQDGDQIATQGFELYPAQPNPWKSNTTLRFFLPQASRATLRVTDQTGKTLWTQTGLFDKGYHCIPLDGTQIQATGVLYYQLETDRFSETRNMVRL
jgi:hypothetical protein